MADRAVGRDATFRAVASDAALLRGKVDVGRALARRHPVAVRTVHRGMLGVIILRVQQPAVGRARWGDEGRGVQISQVVPFPWSDANPLVREYQKLIGGAENYSFTSLEGFIAAKVLVAGLKRAGKNPTRESLVDGLSGMGKTDLGGFTVNYTPTNHNGSSFVDLTIISRGGAFKH